MKPGDTMQEYVQDTLLVIEALHKLAQETSNEIMAEHAWALAEEIAAEEWLTIDDAMKNLCYKTHQ